MMILRKEILNAARSFSASETTIMRDAYVLASDAFCITHFSNADLETKLASIVLFLYTSKKVAHPGRYVEVRELAEESADTLVRFSNVEMRPFGSVQ